MWFTFFARALQKEWCTLLPVSVCLFFTGSAIRRLTGGEWGPCIGAARSVARVTLRAETCVFVSALYLTSFVLHDGLPGSARIRTKEKVFRLSWSLQLSWLALLGSTQQTASVCQHSPGFSPNFQSARANAARSKVTAVSGTAFHDVHRTYLCFLQARVM